ncbi:carbohydrate kinase family protein [Corynebacterium pyruviciproducens]|uniref:Carbohydrate kinase n=1 Tax=Corynebacterium pyruviciproducens TaxID=598660 RepID=A0AAF0YRF2_9CORY|nr:carbohydrate kinase [Corynebacterium pyruviciproducens]WOT01979.1 carbohydrate kinase [Corynebacterium pyruviciproducens]
MITVYGEGLIDLVPRSPAPLAPLVPALGGGPFNVARACGRLGCTTRFVSRLSSDGFGQKLVDALEEAGVDTSQVLRGHQPTTLAVTSIAEDGSASYQFYVDGTADRFAEPEPATEGFASFGTVSLALEPAASRYAEACAASDKNGVVCCLDPNIRTIYNTPEHREFLGIMLPHITVLKMSDAEVDFMGDVSEVPVVITTCGGEGISIRAPFGELTVATPKVEVADTIGAGDTVMAALLAEFERLDLDREKLLALGEAEWSDILTFAARAAAITVTRTGADTPTRDEVR